MAFLINLFTELWRKVSTYPIFTEVQSRGQGHDGVTAEVLRLGESALEQGELMRGKWDSGTSSLTLQEEASSLGP